VVHAAGLFADALVDGITPADLSRVWAPKVAGAWRLHEATEHADLDWFVLFSSAAALLGSPGQAVDWPGAAAIRAAGPERRRALIDQRARSEEIRRQVGEDPHIVFEHSGRASGSARTACGCSAGRDPHLVPAAPVALTARSARAVAAFGPAAPFALAVLTAPSSRRARSAISSSNRLSGSASASPNRPCSWRSR